MIVERMQVSKNQDMTDSRSRAEKRARKRAKEIRDFVGHLGSYLSVIFVLLVINLLTSPDSLWFYWPMLGWGIAVAIHAINTFGPGHFFDDAWEERHVRRTLAKQQAESAVPNNSPTDIDDEMRQVIDRASGLVDTMRASARRVPDSDVRRRALDACAASDQALAAIMEHPEELPLARDFVNRFLEPATTVMSDYSRLANRNVPSARATLTQVEQQDLPLITRKANELYDRLHRGTLIDLEVAREMLTLDIPDAHREELSQSGE